MASVEFEERKGHLHPFSDERLIYSQGPLAGSLKFGAVRSMQLSDPSQMPSLHVQPRPLTHRAQHGAARALIPTLLAAAAVPCPAPAAVPFLAPAAVPFLAPVQSPVAHPAVPALCASH